MEEKLAFVDAKKSYSGVLSKTFLLSFVWWLLAVPLQVISLIAVVTPWQKERRVSSIPNPNRNDVFSSTRPAFCACASCHSRARRPEGAEAVPPFSESTSSKLSRAALSSRSRSTTLGYPEKKKI